MSFTSETIRQRCLNKEEYEKGNELAGQAAIDTVQSFWKGEVTIQAHVEEAGQSYKVRLCLQDGDYQSWQCSCGSGLRGLCRHAAAASLSYYAMIRKKTQLQVSTAPVMQKILKDYQNQGIAALMQTQQEGQTWLIPTLSIVQGRAGVSLRIGNSKKSYLIKNLTEFYFHMKNRETVEYGKTLKLTHSEWFFSRESLPLLRLVMEAMEQELEYYKQYNPYRPESGLKCRELPLFGERLDRLMALYVGREISLQDNTGWERPAGVVAENPPLHVRLEAEAGGYQLTLEEAVTVIEGSGRLYVILGSRIYCADPEFTGDTAAFLREAGRGKGSSFPIARRDMPELCGQLLPCLTRWMQVDTGELDLKQYTPRPVEASFSFDVNGEGAVTCEERLIYGGFSFNPVKGSSVPVNVYRDYPGEYRIRTAVERYFKYYDLDTGCLLLYEEDEIFELLENGMTEFMQLGEVYVSAAFKAVRVIAAPRVSVGVSLSGNMLELTVDAGGLGEEELSELLNSYRLKKKFYRLKQGEFIKIADTSLAAFFEAADGLKLSGGELAGDSIQVPAYRAMYLENVLSEGGLDFRRSREFRSMIRVCKNIGDSDFEVPEGLTGTLRGYQKTGYRWLRTLSQYGFGGILADEMGLGKTVQVIALLLSVKDELVRPALIVCPASLVYNWESELQRFAPELSVSVINGSAEEREQLMLQKPEAQIWITSYDLLKRDIELYENRSFSYQIIDEAQVIKNHSTQGARAVKAIHADHRFALTGTPIENRLSELWSIFDYLMQGYLYSHSHFKEEMEIPIVRDGDEQAAQRLRRMLKPFVLRRLKSEVLRELPEKLETVVYSRLEGEQRMLYAAYAARVREQLERTTPEEYREGRIQILAALTRLRQICCDPGLCYEDYNGGSAKLDTCLELIAEGLEAGHRFLLFSQFTTMLEQIRSELEKRRISYFVLTGSTPKQQRMQMADRFNAGEGEVFLISLKAGGTGLNLTGADMVIHYDPWWNLAAQNQATDRAHRIGQANRVTVLKLVARGTIEENIIRLQEDKHRLSEQIIGGEQSGISSMSQEELLAILKDI